MQNNRMLQPNGPEGGDVWARWLFASVIGMLLGGYYGGRLGNYLYPPPSILMGAPSISSFMVFAILLEAILVGLGLAQWCILHFLIPRAWRWMLATGVSGLPFVLLVWLSEDNVELFETIVYSIFLIGLVTGTCQWLVLRTLSSWAGWWIVINIVVWLVAPFAWLFTADVTRGASLEFPDEFVAALVGSTTYAALTGVGLVFLLRRPRNET